MSADHHAHRRVIHAHHRAASPINTFSIRLVATDLQVVHHDEAATLPVDDAVHARHAQRVAAARRVSVRGRGVVHGHEAERLPYVSEVGVGTCVQTHFLGYSGGAGQWRDLSRTFKHFFGGA
jgi:hypothetical protein